MYASTQLTKNELEGYLKDLGKELKKEYGKHADIELIIVGGAAIALNHEFRETTKDIDGILARGTSSIKDAVYRVADKNNLSTDWLNFDFRNTTSYSSKLVGISKHYKTFGNVLEVRIVDDEYLVAMKLQSFRPYKYDRSDIIGLISENPNITVENVKNACIFLYGSETAVSPDAWKYLNDVISGKLEYKTVAEEEQLNKDTLVDFGKDYEGVLNENNVESILTALKEKQKECANVGEQDIAEEEKYTVSQKRELGSTDIRDLLDERTMDEEETGTDDCSDLLGK